MTRAHPKGAELREGMSPVPGLRVHIEAIAPVEESELVSEFDAWSTGWERPRLRPGLRESRREMRCFGWRYVTTGRGLEPAERIPPDLLAIRDRCAVTAGLEQAPFEQIIVTRYEEGAGIGWHSDAPVFGPVVMTLSLLTDWRMDFDRHELGSRVRVPLARRSLLVLEGEARFLWRHRIAPVKTRRYSVSFRSISERRNA